MDDNGFEIDGVVYESISDLGKPCAGCAFYDDCGYCSANEDARVPSCRDLIFVEKHP